MKPWEWLSRMMGWEKKHDPLMPFAHIVFVRLKEGEQCVYINGTKLIMKPDTSVETWVKAPLYFGELTKHNWDEKK